MTYATLSDLSAYLGTFVPGPITTPTATQVQELLDKTATEIDAALASRGLAVPVASPAEFVSYLVQLNAMGAAGFTLYQAFPETVAPGQTPYGAFLCKSYQSMLDGFRKGIGIPVGLARAEIQQSPVSFFTDTGSWGLNMQDVDDFGDLIRSKPAFSRTRLP